MTNPALAQAFVPMVLLGLMSEDVPVTVVQGAVLLADLANFTGLTEALAKKAGTDGGELVGRDLNKALGPVIDAVVRHGGDVLKFSGDGLLCIFPDDLPLASAARLAAADIAAAVIVGPAGETHQFRVAIVHGPVTLLRLGGHRGRHELVASGAALAQAQKLVPLSAPGAAGSVTILAAPAAVALRRPIPAFDPLGFLPEFVRSRLADGLSEWLQELRTLTVMFIAADTNSADKVLQDQSRAIQVAVEAHGGQLLRFNIEAGCLVSEVAFGLAVGPAATGPADALQCARDLAQHVANVQVGISTGRVLLGPIGSASRRQLTTLGAPVNLAARLMQRAAHEALVDEATWTAGQGRFTGTPQHAYLKGLGDRKFWRLDDAAALRATPDDALFGRNVEVNAVRNTLARAGIAQPIVILGEAGIGKSHFGRWLAGELLEMGVNVVTTLATSVGRDLPYSGLAQALFAMCGLRAGGVDEHKLRQLASRVLGHPDRAPLLADALGASMADTDQTRALIGRTRAENIREALTALARDWQSRGPAALVVEDAHWLDSASWAMLQRIASEFVAFRIVVVCRPMQEFEPPELREITQLGALVLMLEPLPAEDIESVILRRMGVADAPKELVRWIVERARGNAFFAQELAGMLIAVGQVVVQDGKLLRTPGRSELDTLPPVPTIESTLEQRIDRLGRDDSVTLKLASVIGPTFELDALAALKTGTTGDSVEVVVQRLVAADMAVPVGPGLFAFRHQYTLEAAYRMLPGEKRRQLHRQVGMWFEQHLDVRAEQRAGELAHHWFAAEDQPRAVRWLEQAGAQALRKGADREAATHFRRALSIADEQPVGRVAAWRRQLALALFGLGEVEGVAVEARAAVQLVARSLPDSALGWLWLSARTALGRWLGVRDRVSRGSVTDEDLLEAARAAGLLAESAYFLNAPEMMVGSSLLAVDLAERTPSASPVSVAYGMLGVVAGMARLHGVARRYLARARALSEAAGNPHQLGVAWFYTSMYFGCVGDWDASLDAAERALALTERLGADMQSGFELTLIATNALYTSDYTKARAWMETVRSRAERAANVQQIGWACNVVSVAELHQERYNQAIDLSERARQIFLVERDLVSLIIAEGVQCAALARSGRMNEALTGADRLTNLLASARPTTWGQLEGFAGPCEVYATAIAIGAVAHADVQASLRKVMASLRLFALVFPFGRARHRWIQGVLLDALGRRRAARRRFKQAIEVARRFRMPFEEQRASALLAPLVDEPARDELLQRASLLGAHLRAGVPQAQPEVQAV